MLCSSKHAYLIQKIYYKSVVTHLKSIINNNKYTHIIIKLLIYKWLLKPIWTYRFQLWVMQKNLM